MLIISSPRTVIRQSVSEVYKTGMVPLGAVSHMYNFINNIS